jgi:cytochrome P450
MFALPTGTQWQHHRKALQPAFGPYQLRHAITVTNEIVSLAIEKINERIDQGNGVGIVDAPRLAGSLTADVMYVARRIFPFSLAFFFLLLLFFFCFIFEGIGLTPCISSRFCSGRVAFSKSFDRIASFNSLEETHLKQIVREEVETVLGKDGLPTWENYTQLKLCEGVAKEVLRLTPVVAAINRAANKEFTILGHEIAKGTIVFINLTTLHRDPALWGEDADEFKPDRWLEKERIPDWAFLPFGGGGHACIGSKLALLELTTMIALLVRSFDLSLVPGQKLRRITSITTGLKDGANVEFRRRMESRA